MTVIVRPLCFRVICEPTCGRRGSDPARTPIDFEVARSVPSLAGRGGVTRTSATLASSSARRQSAADVAQTREAYERLCRQRRDRPRKIRLGDVSDGDPVKLTYERKLITDCAKMCAYDVETQLTEMLDGIFRRNDLEGRAVVREIFQTPGDLTLSRGQLHIHLNQLSAPRYTEAMMSLCDQINAMDATLPETSFRLRFHVNPRPESGQ